MPWLFLIARAVYYQADRLVHMRDISMSMLKGSTTAARRFHESAPRSPRFEEDLCVQIAEMGLGCWGGETERSGPSSGPCARASSASDCTLGRSELTVVAQPFCESSVVYY